MGTYSINIILSIINFLTIFITFSVSVSFYGRLILSAIKVEEKPVYGQPLTMVTGLTAYAFLCNLISPWVSNYTPLAFILFYLGLIGFIIEFIFIQVPKIWKLKNNKDGKLFIIKKSKIFSSLIIQSLVFAFMYSAVWPSGEMETWTSTSTDFYLWPLMSDYLMGKVDPEVFSLGSDLTRNVFDSFGTHVIFGWFTVASNQTALFSWPTLAVTWLVWSGAAIRNIVSKIFSFGFWPSLFISTCVIGGAFYNYVVADGMMGQLLSMFCFLVALERIFNWRDLRCPKINELKGLLPPVLFIFLGYQGGYVAFMSMIAMVAGLTGFFVSKNVPIKMRITKGIIWGIWPAFSLTIISSILQPATAIHLFYRSFAVAKQTTGWSIPFIDPWLLSGLPVYKANYFFDEDVLSPVSYIPFILLLIIFYFSIFYKDKNQNSLVYNTFDLKTNPEVSVNNFGLITSITFSFLISLVIYICAFLVIGNQYQVWKFASFICLPLSFVPISLTFYFIKQLLFTKFKYISIITIFCIFTYWIYTICLLPPFIEVNKIIFKVDNSKVRLSIFEYILNNNKDKILLSYLHDNSSCLLLAEFFKNQTKIKFITFIPLPNFKNEVNLQHQYNSHENLAIISDRDFTGLFNSVRGFMNFGKIYLIDKEELRRKGFVSTFGILINDNWRIYTLNIFRLLVTVPEKLYNKKVKLKISMITEEETINKAYNKDCFRKLKIWVQGAPEPIYGEEGSFEIVAPIPSELITNNSFTVRAKVLESIEPAKAETCGPTYLLDRVEVYEDTDAVAN